MKYLLTIILLANILCVAAQVPVETKDFNNTNGAELKVSGNSLDISWPVNESSRGKLSLDLRNNKPLFRSIALNKEIIGDIDPVFLLSVGKRDLISQNGWNIFFDKVPLKPHTTHRLKLNKKSAAVRSVGSRTFITIDEVSAPGFTGAIEIILFNGSPLVNIAAVISTQKDSTAILYDAGLLSTNAKWKSIAWSNVYDSIQDVAATSKDTAVNRAVKYRTIIGATAKGSIAVFPPPHQYFYPLDEAFNLAFTWHGSNYRKMIDGYGIGIRQDLYGDKRFVPWFNSPPGTKQRLNFFLLLSNDKPSVALAEVKKFTHDDRYVSLPGHKTLSSHFHNEFIMNVVMKNKPVPDTPVFVKVFRNLGIDIIHLGEFHYTAHPKGPDELRLKELQALFELCKRVSNDRFLLLPGEEPNEFFAGHWMQLFPRPVYWIMSRKSDQPFVTDDPTYGKVYRIGNAEEMLELLKKENGLAWTAHPRTKGSTGYPDKYKSSPFFKSEHFLGAAWKPIPADLSLPRLGTRVLDLLDDMNNWGDRKRILAEADIFTVTPENEMYAHMNVNYLRMNKLPSFSEGWQPVVDILQKGDFFSTTGEVLIPSFNLSPSGDSSTVSFTLQWTFPMNFAEIISGDGNKVYRHRINLDSTVSFGKRDFSVNMKTAGLKWVRLEAWDAAANGAFTQTVWLNN
jgi:hypothetical protein